MIVLTPDLEAQKREQEKKAQFEALVKRANSEDPIAAFKLAHYYYKKQAKVIVKHIDEETGKELADPEEDIKDLGDPYSAEPKTIPKTIEPAVIKVCVPYFAKLSISCIIK